MYVCTVCIVWYLFVSVSTCGMHRKSMLTSNVLLLCQCSSHYVRRPDESIVTATPSSLCKVRYATKSIHDWLINDLIWDYTMWQFYKCFVLTFFIIAEGQQIPSLIYICAVSMDLMNQYRLTLTHKKKPWKTAIICRIKAILIFKSVIRVQICVLVYTYV